MSPADDDIDDADGDDADDIDADDIDADDDGLVLDDEGEATTNLSYEEADDVRAESLLSANGFATTREALVEVLTGSGSGVLRAAAARTLGVRCEMSAVDELLDVARASDDLLRAEAAFATARMGVAEGLHLLKKCLTEPVAISLGAPTAAGFLARIGDPRGWPVVADALDQANFLIRIVGAKQLLYFAPFDGPSVDVYAEFARALADDEEDVAEVAAIQLRQLSDPRAAALLGA